MIYSSIDDFEALMDAAPFAELASPFGGLIASLLPIRSSEFGAVPVHIFNCSLGSPRMAFPRISTVHGRTEYGNPIGGAGADEDATTARVRALAEALERYATCVLLEKELVVSTQRELGDQALDLTKLPQCSEQEYANPLSHMMPANPDTPVRWVRGLSLVHGREVYVPAIMTHLYGRPWQSERFWVQITTGVAAHTDPLQAIVRAICEVIERDAISLTWLAKLGLPRIHFDELPPPEFASRFRAAANCAVQHHFFDATTDVGVPTVYLVQILKDHPNVAQFVNCATSFTPWEACAKLLREAAAGRPHLEENLSFPDDLDEFVAISHGAAYMGQSDQRHEFEFLLGSKRSRNISEITPPVVGNNSAEQLDFLVGRLRALNMDAIAVDLTTDELRDAGLCVVRVLIPDLMPMTPIHTARFLAHPRLYSYPEAAGFGRRTLADINKSPQPFA